MKQIFYFILLIAGFSSIHSCKDLLDEDGNPLLDLNNTGGLSGPRALYKEITDKTTLAEYQYSGLLMNRVITDSASITDIMYSGDRISQINFRVFLILMEMESWIKTVYLTRDSSTMEITADYSLFLKPVLFSEDRHRFRLLLSQALKPYSLQKNIFIL